MPDKTPQLQPIVPSYRLRILSDEQLAQLKSATLEILEEVGVHCPSKKTLAIYAEHGAQVDFDHKIVKLPADIVLKAMSHAPRFYTMAARSAAHDLKLDGTALYCATDGCGVETIAGPCWRACRTPTCPGRPACASPRRWTAPTSR